MTDAGGHRLARAGRAEQGLELQPSLRPSTRRSIAWGWSPVGRNGASSLKSGMRASVPRSPATGYVTAHPFHSAIGCSADSPLVLGQTVPSVPLLHLWLPRTVAQAQAVPVVTTHQPKPHNTRGAVRAWKWSSRITGRRRRLLLVIIGGVLAAAAGMAAFTMASNGNKAPDVAKTAGARRRARHPRAHGDVAATTSSMQRRARG